MPDQQDPQLAGAVMAPVACTPSLDCVPEAYPSVSHCENTQLFMDIPMEYRLAWSTLKQWEQRARLLQELSRCALHNRQAMEAADFREAANRLEGWVVSLSKLLSKRRLLAADVA